MVFVAWIFTCIKFIYFFKWWMCICVINVGVRHVNLLGMWRINTYIQLLLLWIGRLVYWYTLFLCSTSFSLFLRILLEKYIFALDMCSFFFILFIQFVVPPFSWFCTISASIIIMFMHFFASTGMLNCYKNYEN